MESATRTAMYRYLIVLTVASTVGLQSWRTLFNNFAVDVARLNGQQVGIIQSLRELPGFLTLLVGFVIRIVLSHGTVHLYVEKRGAAEGDVGARRVDNGPVAAGSAASPDWPNPNPPSRFVRAVTPSSQMAILMSSRAWLY